MHNKRCYGIQRESQTCSVQFVTHTSQVRFRLWNSSQNNVTAYVKKSYEQYTLMVFISSFAKQNRFFHCASDRSLSLLLSTIFTMESYKEVWSLLYSTKQLPPTAAFLCCMKMELVQYSSGKGKHLLKLRCSSLREKQIEGASDVVYFFLRSYFKRPLSSVSYTHLTLPTT